MIGSGGSIEGLLVATDALRRQSEPVELAHGPHLVAGIAINYRVCPNQRKPILVFVDVVDRNRPAVGVMAQLALRAVLAPVQVGVAILALVGSVGEIEIVVAIAASYRRVPPAEWKAGLSMIELDLVPDYLPVLDGMACIARQFESSVRTDRRCEWSPRLRTQGAHTEQEHRRQQDGSAEQQYAITSLRTCSAHVQ
jgi:hypothetical protein